MRSRSEAEAEGKKAAFWDAAAALMGPDGVSVGELPAGVDLDGGVLVLGYNGLVPVLPDRRVAFDGPEQCGLCMRQVLPCNTVYCIAAHAGCAAAS